MQVENGLWAWGLNPYKYVHKAISNCKKYVEENLPNFYVNVLSAKLIPHSYWPELDTLPELPPEHASYYQSLMEMYRWMIELDRVDKSTEVSMLSSLMILLYQRHLEAALHIIIAPQF